ncbi:MAG: chemotaxis protein [Deltaproteobacteria bacterium]|nr:MAG: chemotaxis protein [Deltaproteobacteria bacterium]
MLKVVRLRNMSLGVKIAILPALGVLGIILVSTANWWATRQLDKQILMIQATHAMKRALSETLNLEKNILARRDPELLAPHQKALKKLRDDLKALFKLSDDSEVIANLERMAALLDAHQKTFSPTLQDLRSNGNLSNSAEQMASALDQVLERSWVLIKQAERVGVWISIVSCACALFLLAALGFVISRSISAPLKRNMKTLSEGAVQVTSASEQVSTASQSLAEGASEQASAIEETSSSLEQMSSMTKQNAENAGQADLLMRDTTKIVGQANLVMDELTRSMSEVSEASQETQKIIKDIDEVAFQTNLLALNAAVEAARAGEAGAGFAVVADEVRNLAVRAAEAAKNTATLIETTISKVEAGTGLVEKANEAFTKINESSSKVAQLLSEIAAASSEQAEGIEQINKAIAEMDKVVQLTAANAEESASASEQMNAHAEQMKSVVQDLLVMIEGESARATDKGHVSKHPTIHEVAGGSAERSRLAAPALCAPTSRLDPDPEAIIPMDQDDPDFEDF